jgi:FHA domain
MIKCPNCGTENSDETQICICGNLLLEPGRTKTIPDNDNQEGEPRFGAIRFRENLILLMLDGDKQFIFDREQVDEIWIGRKDPKTGLSPEVDLGDIGTQEGVSRRHAKIMRRDGALHVVDNNSSNGTFLNGQKLVAQQPRVLRDGDDIRLGKLVLRVTLS